MDMLNRWNRNFYASTRGRIVGLLRRAALTVDQLAQALGLTDNAVRSHLAALERDGLVEQDAPKRGSVGKPAHTFRVTDEANQLLSRAYVLVFGRMLDVLAERMSRDQIEAIMRDLGRRLAADRPPPTGSERERVNHAVSLLEDLGGAAAIEERDDTLRIRGFGCPLSAAVRGHPELCGAMEVLLTEVIGTPVHQECEHGDRPQCCFAVAGH